MCVTLVTTFHSLVARLFTRILMRMIVLLADVSLSLYHLLTVCATKRKHKGYKKTILQPKSSTLAFAFIFFVSIEKQ